MEHLAVALKPWMPPRILSDEPQDFSAFRRQPHERDAHLLVPFRRSDSKAAHA
jgi:hypothetical protein